MNKTKGSIGIIVSGGPAPGINGVISSVTNEGRRRGYRVFGCIEGFKQISTTEEPTNAVKELNSENTWGIYTRGGSILGTARYNPFQSDETLERLRRNLKTLEISMLVVIGGEGSAWLSSQIDQFIDELRVVHIPKTIDNDLVLPNHTPSFGFETARYAGTNILLTLKNDAKTTSRWFVVTSMGRKAGFLALGIGVAAGATLTMIPEEYENAHPTPEEVVDTIFSVIKTRYKNGKRYGVVVIAEGILEVLKPEGNAILEQCERDDLGRLRYASVEIGDVLKPALDQKLEQHGLSETRINTKNLGYELRCYDPISFDIEYTTFLGFGAVEYLEQGKSGVMVTRDFDKLSSIDLQEMKEASGLIRSRTVDLNSDLYKVARSFMTKALC